MYCCGIRIGLIKPSILPHLLSYKDVFVGENVEDSIVAVKLSDCLLTVEERTKSINAVFKDLQSTGVFPCLRGWRNEVLWIARSWSIEMYVITHEQVFCFSLELCSGHTVWKACAIPL